MSRVDSEPPAAESEAATASLLSRAADARKSGSATELASIAPTVTAAREAFDSGITKDIEFRKKSLRGLLRFYEENSAELIQALHHDLHKHPFETTLTEVNYLINDAKTMLKNCGQWSQPAAVQRSLATLLDRPYVLPEPYGVVLVMGAWNYPLQLTMAPVSGAIAAGNCVCIKPSELSPATADLLARMLPRYLDSRCYPVVLGSVTECTELLRQRFDYIFYTGGSVVGKIVHRAANEYLTPVTLELGGKSPVYLDDSTNMDYAVRRILWGKIVNLGQTCIAPDYLLCDKAVEARFVELAERVLREWFGDAPEQSPDLGRMINRRHFERVAKLLKCSGRVALGGRCLADENFIEPTVLVDVRPDDPIMQEEIFGPVLPIVTVHGAEEAIQFINSRERPLAAYFFTVRKPLQSRFLTNVSAGGIVFNDVMLHYGVEELPFGGVGMSGMGAYHGRFSFNTFTHYKPVLERGYSAIIEKLCAVRYPPYSAEKIKRAKRLLRNPQLPNLAPLKYVLTFGLGVASVLALQAAAKRFGFEDDLPIVLQ